MPFMKIDVAVAHSFIKFKSDSFQIAKNVNTTWHNVNS